MKKILGFMFVGFILLALIGCSDEANNYSPEKIINNALDDNKTPSYYAESTTSITDMDGETEVVSMKEWRLEDGKSRTETDSEEGKSVAVNDGESITLYQKDKNQAIVIDDEEILEFNQPSPKEQVDVILDMVRDTHDISREGEDEIAGRRASHFIATPEEKDTLYGEQEIWIDKENWMVLKMISTSGNVKTNTDYTKVDFNMDISEEKLILDLPDDVEIINSDDMSETDKVTLDEGKEALGESFNYFSEQDGIEIKSIEVNELGGELDRIELNIDYVKDGMPYLSIAVFESPEDMDDLDMPGEETVDIRDEEGSYTEMDGFRGLVWQEDGLNYSVIIIDPDIIVEDLQEMAEKMEEVN